jgi:2-methylisocitrate lyase-like PEP mutase family enzyme
VLTGRCEGWLVHDADPLRTALDRLVAYAEAGAASQDIKTNGTFNLLANGAASADLNELFRERS